jgi:hypothetical protein
VEICDGFETLYCKGCSKEHTVFPYYSFGINEESTIAFLKQKALILEKNITVLKEEDAKLLLNLDNCKLAVLVSPEKVELSDLYTLKGWSINDHPDFYLMIAAGWSFTLQSEHSKGLIALIGIEQLASPDTFEKQLSIIKYGFNRSKNEKILESNLQWVPEDNTDWLTVEKHWKDLLSNITKYAVQAGDEPGKVQGEKFQRYVINLLRTTVFEAKYIGGKNSPDGTIFIQAPVDVDKSELIPLEVKTDKSKFVSIQEYEGQLRKYIRAFKDVYITKKYVVKRIIVIGNDFKRNNEKEREVIAKLQSDLNVKIVLFPLNSLARLVNLYFQYQISDIDNDRIIDFLNNSYIETTHVDKLMEELRIGSEQKDKDIYDKIKSSLKQVGY